MGETIKQELKPDKNQAKQEVNIILQQICQTGAVDFEPSAFQEILKLLEDGNIEPEEAVRRAREIESSRQDYR